RVVDLAKTVEALCHDWNGLPEPLCLHMTDPLHPRGGEIILLSGSDSGGTRSLSLENETDIPPSCHVIEGDVRAWSQVVVGHLGAEEACSLGLLLPSSPRAAALAAPLFPPRSP